MSSYIDAAIRLCVPMSGETRIDAMIRQARQDRGLDKPAPTDPAFNAEPLTLEALMNCAEEAAKGLDVARQFYSAQVVRELVKRSQPALPDEIGPDHPAVTAFWQAIEATDYKGSNEYAAAGLNAALKVLREGGE